MENIGIQNCEILEYIAKIICENLEICDGKCDLRKAFVMFRWMNSAKNSQNELGSGSSFIRKITGAMELQRYCQF